MKLFDLHADIGYDVMQKKHTETDILNRFHLQKFLEGEVSYIGMASFLREVKRGTICRIWFCP